MAYDDEPTPPSSRSGGPGRDLRAATAAALPDGPDANVPRTYSLTGAAIAIQVLLALHGVVAVATIVDVATSPPGAAGSDTLAELRSVLFLMTGVLWIGWLTTARLNVRAWHAPFQRRWWGWTIVAWFLPVVGLFAPAMITRDVGDATDAPPGSVLALRRPQWLVVAWGLAYAMLTLLVAFAGLERQRSGFDGLAGSGVRRDGMHASAWTLAAAAMTLLAIVPAVALVRSLTRRQSARMQLELTRG